MQTNTSQDDISRMLASIYDGDDQYTPPLDTEHSQVTNEYDVYVESDRITFIKKGGAEEATDTTPQVTVVPAAGKPSDKKPLLDQRTSTQLAYATIIFSLFLILF